MRLAIITLFLLTAGCYRMPENGEYSLIPSTNNPDITRESPNSWTPGVGY